MMRWTATLFLILIVLYADLCMECWALQFGEHVPRGRRKIYNMV